MMTTNLYVGEYIGTFSLVTLTCLTVMISKLCYFNQKIIKSIFIISGLVISILIGINAAKYFGSSFADINPSITLARFISSHAYSIQTMILIQFVQFFGAFSAGITTSMFYYFFRQRIRNTDDILAIFATTPRSNYSFKYFFNELVATFVLVIGINFTSRFQPLSSISIVSIIFWVSICTFANTTGSSLNPARDLGPRLVHSWLCLPYRKSCWQYAIIPILTPYLGALLAAICSFKTL